MSKPVPKYYQAFIDQLDWEKPTNLTIPNHNNPAQKVILIPTIIQSINKTILGLVYSSRESLEMAISQRKGIYYSRQRGIWIKSPSGKNSQNLINVDIDCDRDALLFTVDQKGTFCHRADHFSCFYHRLKSTDDKIYSLEVFPNYWKENYNESIPLLDNKRTHNNELRIAYCKGNSEQPSFKLLNNLGIKVYRNGMDRSVDLMVKSHIHPNIKIFSVRARDIQLVLEKNLADLILCYDNVKIGNFSQYKDELLQWYSKEHIHQVKVVAICRKNWEEEMKSNQNGNLDQPIRIFTEYPELTKKWLETENLNWLNKNKLLIEYVSGNTEELIKNNLGDIGIVVMDTGKTIHINNLKILSEISNNDLAIYFKKSFYSNNPRLMREIRNNLDNSTIFFYSVGDYGGFMSNFYPSHFVDPETGKEFKSSEHYYQANKFINNPEIYEEVRAQPTAKQCYKAAYKYQNLFRKDWFDKVMIRDLDLKDIFLVKDFIMFKALKLKFSQNPELKKMLIETFPKGLVEHSLKDAHYGCGVDGAGKNVLGKMLMKLRSIYINQNSQAKL